MIVFCFFLFLKNTQLIYSLTNINKNAASLYIFPSLKPKCYKPRVCFHLITTPESGEDADKYCSLVDSTPLWSLRAINVFLKHYNQSCEPKFQSHNSPFQKAHPLP